jgi:hypothetical protein
MPHEHEGVSGVDGLSLFSYTAVRPYGHGGWVSEVRLGDGASVSKWFATEEEARRYPRELAQWLLAPGPRQQTEEH